MRIILIGDDPNWIHRMDERRVCSRVLSTATRKVGVRRRSLTNDIKRLDIISMQSRGYDFGWMLLLGAIWGGSFLFMRVAAPEFGPVPLIFVRLAIASVILFAMVTFRGQQRALFRHPVKMAFLGLTNSALPYSLFAYATLSLSAGFASILNATAPFFGAFLSVLVFREGLRRLQWIGLCIGFAGVCVLVWDKMEWTASGPSVAAGLAAALLYGVAAHFSKRQLSHVPALVVATDSQIMATLLLIPIAWWVWPEQSPSIGGWMAAGMLGSLCTGLALAIYFPLLHSIGPTRTMTVAYLIPMFGVIWGVLFLNEAVTRTLLVGGGLILCGLICVTRSKPPVFLPPSAKTAGPG